MAWESAERVQKNSAGEYRALIGGQWVPVAKAQKNAAGQFRVERVAAAPAAEPVVDAVPQGRGNWLSDVAAEVVNPNIAPLATAALAGGAVGGIPGAALAAGGLLATDLAVGGVVNPVLEAFGQQPISTASEAINAIYGPNVVAPEATTSGRRAARTVGAFVAPTRGTITAANELAARATSPVTQNVLRSLAEKPAVQTAAAIGAGSLVGAGQEAGVDNPFALAALGVAGGFAPSLTTMPIKAALRMGGNVVEPFLPGGAESVKARAYLEAFDNDPNKVQQAINMMEMGTPPEKVATAMNASGFAALLGSARNASTVIKDLYLARDAAIQQGQANQLAMASRSVNAFRTALDKEQAARAAALTQQEEAAAAILRKDRERLASGLPKTSQLKVGETVTQRRAEELERVTNDIVRPAYQKAFAAAPTPFSFAGVEAAARELASETGTLLNPQQAPYTTDVIALYRAKPVMRESKGWGSPYRPQTVQMPTGETTPAMVTLEEADTFIKALNQDLASLSGNMDPSANVTRRNLTRLKTAAMQAIEAGTEGTNAAKLYTNARELFRTQVAEKFRTGWVANLEREGATGVQLVAPEAVVKTILTNEENAVRFLAALGEDRLATDAVRQGIVDRYRREVVRDGVVVPSRSVEFLRKYDDALQVLEQSGIKVTKELESFNAAAARLAEAGETATVKAATEFKPRQQQLKELERRVTTLANRVNVDPKESAEALEQRMRSSAEVADVVGQIRRDMADKKRFEKLVREGVAAGGGVRELTQEQAGPKLQIFDQLYTFANYLLTRAQGKIDAKLAAEVAQEMLTSDPAAKALATAIVKGQRSKIGKALQRPVTVPGAGPTLNVLAPSITYQSENRNQLRPQ